MKTREIDTNTFHTLHKEGFFCGPPDEAYIQIVIKALEDANLFNLKSLLVLCRIEHEFMQSKFYKDLCIASKLKKCCRPWSLGNYIALLTNRTSCLALTVRLFSLSAYCTHLVLLVGRRCKCNQGIITKLFTVLPQFSVNC